MIDLSPREKQVLQLTWDGHARKETANILQLSERTVQNCRDRLYRKLGVGSAVQAVRKGLELGIIEVMR